MDVYCLAASADRANQKDRCSHAGFYRGADGVLSHFKTSDRRLMAKRCQETFRAGQGTFRIGAEAGSLQLLFQSVTFAHMGLATD